MFIVSETQIVYEVHESFLQPQNENVKVWRYMDFTKLISLLDSETLFFTRADKFEDPFEGSFPKLNFEARKIGPDGLPADDYDAYKKTVEWLEHISKHLPKHTAINCWHMNEHESAAMWKLYLKSDEGIAIQSTYANLRDSITDTENVFLGIVRYIDYENEGIEIGNSLRQFMYKRESFVHEREVRALVSKIKAVWGVDGTWDLSQASIEFGINIKIDLKTLVNRIYVAPNTPEWLVKLVQALIHKRAYPFESGGHKVLSGKPW